MANKEYFSRIIHKHDTQANWDKATNFIPKLGELIIYDPDEEFDENGEPREGIFPYARMKIGDGINTVQALGFYLEEEMVEIWAEFNRVQQELNKKVEGEISGRTLTLHNIKIN